MRITNSAPLGGEGVTGRIVLERERIAGLWVDDMCRYMDANQIAAADVAKFLGKSPSAISQLLSGARNLTLDSMVGVALACGLRVEPPIMVPLAGRPQPLHRRHWSAARTVPSQKFVRAPEDVSGAVSGPRLALEVVRGSETAPEHYSVAHDVRRRTGTS